MAKKKEEVISVQVVVPTGVRVKQVLGVDRDGTLYELDFETNR